MIADERRYESVDDITEIIIGAAYQVANTLGVGFLEKVYENALVHEIRKRGLRADQQVPIEVVYDGVLVGQYFAGILVESMVIIELKYAKNLDDSHMAQCINYLKATGKTLALLINFGASRVQIKRVVLNHQ
jgi:GxxExxY protein